MLLRMIHRIGFVLAWCFATPVFAGGFSYSDDRLLDNNLIKVVAEPSLMEIKLLYSQQDVLIFGSISQEAEIVLRVSSPTEPFMVNRRKNKYGFWVRDYGWDIRDTSAFYGVYSSGNLNQLLSSSIRENYGFILERGLALPARFSLRDDKYDFYQGLLRQRQAQNLWQQREGEVQIDDNLFRVRIDIPPQAPDGDYRIEAFLITNTGDLLSRSSFIFEVRRGGFNRIFYLLSQEDAFLYGLGGVVFCFVLGLVVALVFRRY